MVTHHDDGEWMTIAAAARRLGVSRQAIQKRINRGKIENRRDNMGNPMVRVAAPPPQQVPGAPHRTGAATEVAAGTHQEPSKAPQEAPGMVPLSALQEAISALQASHNQALAALQQAMADREQQHQQSTRDMSERHQRHLEHVTRQHQTSMALLVERIDRAEVLIDKLLDRPWWRRFLGR